MAEKETKNISPSKATAAKTIYEAFKILKSEDGELPGKEVIDHPPGSCPRTGMADIPEWQI